MSLPSVIRRPAIPRLHTRLHDRLPGQTALPGFLIEHRAVPMMPAPVTGPQDALEQAIVDGFVWETEAEPVEFDSFDAEEDVISVIIETGDGELEFEVLEGKREFQILANGKPMARVAAPVRSFSNHNIRVLQARQPG
ncbi:MAG: hypothetical protein AAF231_08310 [Pseudomonadota bacterium]